MREVLGESCLLVSWVVFGGVIVGSDVFWRFGGGFNGWFAAICVLRFRLPQWRRFGVRVSLVVVALWWC